MPILLLAVGSACGASRPDASPSGPGAATGPSQSQAAYPASQRSYLRRARRTSSSIDIGEAGRDATLLSIGKDWCRWRDSPDFGDVPPRQFFGEIEVGARDGAIIRRAAEADLCPR